MSVWGVATCGDEPDRPTDSLSLSLHLSLWVAVVASRRCHKLSLPVNHVPYLTTLMCIARINIYGITLTVSPARSLAFARARRNVSSKWAVGLTRNCIRIKMRAARWPDGRGRLSADRPTDRPTYLSACLPTHPSLLYSAYLSPLLRRAEITARKKSSRNERDGDETNSTSRGVYIKERPRARERRRGSLFYMDYRGK